MKKFELAIDFGYPKISNKIVKRRKNWIDSNAMRQFGPESQ